MQISNNSVYPASINMTPDTVFDVLNASHSPIYQKLAPFLPSLEEMVVEVSMCMIRTGLEARPYEVHCKNPPRKQQASGIRAPRRVCAALKHPGKSCLTGCQLVIDGAVDGIQDVEDCIRHHIY